MDQIDTNIHNTELNHNYDIPERTLKETQSKCYLGSILRPNHKKTEENLLGNSKNTEIQKSNK